MVGSVGNSNNNNIIQNTTLKTNTDKLVKPNEKKLETTSNNINNDDNLAIENKLIPVSSFEPTFNLSFRDATTVSKNLDLFNLKFDLKNVTADSLINELQGKVKINDSIKSLSDKFFTDGKIKNSKTKDLEKAIESLLSNTDTRKDLIQVFKLDSKMNEKCLVLASTLESDDIRRTSIDGDEQKVKENVFPVGVAILNRTIATNIVRAASHQSKTNNASLDGFKPLSIYNIVTEPSQFSISAKFKAMAKNLHADKKDITDNSNLELHRELIKDVLSGSTAFKIGEKDCDASNVFYFQNKSLSSSNTTYNIAFKSPNKHVFSTYCDSKKTPYAIFNSFDSKLINWNK